MGQILIRNLDDSVIDALKRRAADHAISAEEEARRVLTFSVGLGREDAVRRLNAVRAELGPSRGPTSLELLREDRARDDNA
ncbi:FitA-like ribbon-helix-helix domain-containing protein [Caulobacter sp. LARHSG274]|jgi:plasmid stability protein